MVSAPSCCSQAPAVSAAASSAARVQAQPSSVSLRSRDRPSLGSRGCTRLDQLLDELAGGLLAHAQVVGDFDDRSVARTDANEDEAMGGANVGEPAFREPVLDPVDYLGGRPEDEHRHDQSIVITHSHSLSDPDRGPRAP